MSRLAHLFKKPDTRMKAILVSLVVIVFAAVFFIVHENQVHREKYLEVYRMEQLAYTGQLANQLEPLMTDEAGDDLLVSCMAEICEVSANHWSFLCRGEEVLFAKDVKTTGNLREEKKKSSFMDTVQGQNAVLTMVEKEFGGTDYVIGTITDENYALSKGGVKQHEIYLYLVVGIFIMLAVMAIIGLTAKLNQVERTLQNTSDALQRQNIKLERAGEETVLLEQKEDVPIEKENQNFYDSDLIRMFLSKSDDAALMPMQILFIDLIMESRYYSRKEIFDVMEGVRKFLGPTHVTGEIQKGRFVVLMYRTSAEEAQNILEQCRTYAERKKEENGIRLNMHIAEVKEGKNALAVYEEGWKRGYE